MATMLDSKSTLLRVARLEIEEFNYAYAETLDAMDVDGWVEYFTEDAFYHVIARIIESGSARPDLLRRQGDEDRAYALLNTEMFAPRYLHLSITNTRALALTATKSRHRPNTLIETLVEETSRIQQVGKYRDVFVREGGKLLLKERICIYDSVMIDNCLVFPV